MWRCDSGKEQKSRSCNTKASTKNAKLVRNEVDLSISGRRRFRGVLSANASAASKNRFQLSKVSPGAGIFMVILLTYNSTIPQQILSPPRFKAYVQTIVVFRVV